MQHGCKWIYVLAKICICIQCKTCIIKAIIELLILICTLNKICYILLNNLNIPIKNLHKNQKRDIRIYNIFCLFCKIWKQVLSQNLIISTFVNKHTNLSISFKPIKFSFILAALSKRCFLISSYSEHWRMTFFIFNAVFTYGARSMIYI